MTKPREMDATTRALIAQHLADVGFAVDEEGGPDDVDLLAQPMKAPEVRVGIRFVDAHPDEREVAPAVAGLDALALGFRRVTPAHGRRLREAGQAYIDASGNAWIEAPGVHVHVEGRRPDVRARASTPTGWAVRPSGLQVVFALLTLPQLTTGRLADIAAAAGVSTTTTHHVMRDLAARAWIDGDGAHRIWLDRDAAGRAWLNGHLTRPPAPAGQYVVHGVEPRQWATLLADTAAPGWLSGAAALEADGAGLQADVATVYAPTPFTPSKGVRLARPRLGEPPNLIVRAPWWTPDAYASGLAPRLLACADALGSGDPRAAATAREVMADDPDLRRLLAT
ncbi:hypothetical protein [uncultured Microbacterium sp.]|uniref:hypothetical protein n=2 Tax=uncultured Microbacterium sp. TaxID=191216 RepID=UPI0025DCF5BA|nr:hypothetical protein [uncultured Microbacterium sp.]